MKNMISISGLWQPGNVNGRAVKGKKKPPDFLDTTPDQIHRQEVSETPPKLYNTKRTGYPTSKYFCFDVITFITSSLRHSTV